MSKNGTIFHFVVSNEKAKLYEESRHSLWTFSFSLKYNFPPQKGFDGRFSTNSNAELVSPLAYTGFKLILLNYLQWICSRLTWCEIRIRPVVS